MANQSATLCKQYISLIASVCLVGAQMAFAHEIVIDTSHSGAPPILDTTPNNIDMIHIANPNNAGISNNFYQDFNINEKGLILNNITKDEQVAQTLLAGYISANPHLDRSAKLILNQVTGSAVSNLLGFLEVAGSKADVIIANPNGITCKNCGFINVENATLATGRFSKEELHRLDTLNHYNEIKSLALDITQGKIITSALNANSTKTLTFLAKNMEINGVVSADEIRAVLGSNHIEFSPSVLLYEPITIKDSDNNQKQVLALDVSYLGAAIAKSIYIVATSEGVGVKSSGLIATTASKTQGDGGFYLDVNGRLEISTPQESLATIVGEQAGLATTTAQNLAQSIDENLAANATSSVFIPALIANADMNIKAKEVINRSIIYANDNIFLEADSLLNKGSLEFVLKQISSTHHHYRIGAPEENDTFDYDLVIKEDILKSGSYSPAMIIGSNITLKATSITNDTAILHAKENLDIQSEDFANIDPQARRITSYENGVKKHYNRYGKCFLGIKWGWNCASTTNVDSYKPADRVEYISATLPQISIQKIASLMTNSLDSALTSAPLPLVHTQDSATISRVLASSIDTSKFFDIATLEAISRQNLGLQAGMAIIASNNFYNTSGIYTKGNLAINSAYTLNENGIISADNIRIESTQMQNNGGTIQAENDINIHADSVSISSLASNNTITSYGKLYGKNITINATDEAMIRGADLEASNSIAIKTDRLELSTLSYNQTNLSKQETIHTGSSLNADNISLTAGKDASFKSVSMNASDSIAIDAGGNITFDTAQNVSTHSTTSTSSSLLGWSKTTTTTTTTTHTNIANNLQAGNITINAGDDLTAYNLKAEAKQNLALNASDDMLLSTKADSKEVFTQKTETKWGFRTSSSNVGGSHSFSLAFGRTKTNTSSTQTDSIHNAQTLSGENIALAAGNALRLESINLNGENTTISGDSVAITALQDSSSFNQSSESVFHGGGIGLGVSKDILLGNGLEARLGYYQFNESSSTQSNSTSSVSSSIASTNLAINANKNLDITASNLSGDNIALNAKEVNINAQADTSATSSHQTRENWFGGASIGANLIDKITIGASLEVIRNEQANHSQSTIHTGSLINAENLAINTHKDTNIIGSILNATHTDIKANNVYLGASTDMNMDYGYGYGYGGSFNIGYSANLNLDVGINGGAQANGNANASLVANNAQITTDTLNITTHKNSLLDGVSFDLSGVLTNPKDVIAENAANALETIGENLAHSMIKGNGSLVMTGGNINIKDNATIDLQDNLVMTSQHNVSANADMNMEAHTTDIRLMMFGLSFLKGGGVANATATTSLASMSGISSQGGLSISTSHTKASEITGEIAGFITDIGAYLFGEKIGDMIGNYTSPYVDELGSYKNTLTNLDSIAIGNTNLNNILNKTENTANNLGSISGNLIKENHTLLGDIVSNTIKGGNTFMSNSYIQANGEASINTDNLVNVDIGNVGITTNQDINIFKIETLVNYALALVDVFGGNYSGSADKLLLTIPLEGNTSVTTNNNHSSISENITINANNTPTIIRGGIQNSSGEKTLFNHSNLSAINIGELIRQLGM